MRRALTAAALALPLTLLAIPAQTAEAAPKGVPDSYYEITNTGWNTGGANLWVAPTAQLKKGGFVVTWSAAFVCPKGKRYAIDGTLGNLNPASVPPLQDGDGWIYAGLNKPVRGTCTGKVQTVKLQLHTRKASWGDTYFNGTFYPAGSGWFPLVPDTSAETDLRLQGDGFSALYADNVGAIQTAEKRVALIKWTKSE